MEKQKIVVLLLILAILFSVATIFMTLSTGEFQAPGPVDCGTVDCPDNPNDIGEIRLSIGGGG